jgi:cobalt/nickel transport system permease protein
MASIDGALLDFRRLDQLACGRSRLHRLDPRAKALTTLAFLVCIVSFGRYELSALVPFVIFPAVLIGAADLPAGYLARKVALVLPFALLVGILNPVFDRTVMLQLGPLPVTGGWISCASIVLRALLSVTAALTLISLTGFPALCRAMEGLGMPRAFAVQLVFLYRYIFVLSDETARAARARELRSFGRKGQGMASYSSLVGHLLLRTWQRAERVHMSMLARGFSGAFPGGDDSRLTREDFLFVAGWSALFLFLRLNNISRLAGTLITGH